MDYNIKDETLTIFLKGKVNSSNSEEVEQGIECLLKINQFKSIVLDLGKLEYISSAGLRIIVRIKQQYEDIKLVNVSNVIYDIFDMVGLTTVLTVERK